MGVGRHRTTVASGRLQPSVVKNHAPGLTAFSRSFWRMAALTAAGAIGATSYTQAAVVWSDSDGLSRSGPSVPARRPNARRHAGKKIEAPEKEAAKPQGPLIIAISIQQQKLRLYDANGFYAETPISTGMPGHPTPMGVFSVIEKQKLHHSNIYSGAPMPFMQRITWSGIAMHAGVLPGHPASHGCIRMPMAFAVKMYGWTKMGARVVVTPGEMTPAAFSHPLLAAQKIAPQPVAAAEPPADAKVDVKSDKAANANDSVKTVMEPSAATPLREQTHTADASAALPKTKTAITMSDASSSGGAASPRQEIVAATDHAAETVGDAASDKAIDASNAQQKSEDEKTEVAKSEIVKSEAEPAISKPSETASSEDKPVETKPSETAAPEIKTAETGTSDKTGQKMDEAAAPAPANTEPPKTEVSASDASKPPAVEAKSLEKADDKVKSPTETGTLADGKKDQARPPNNEKAAASKPDPAAALASKHAGQISVFVSRKDSKLYVRQNFAPLFDVPVTIAPDDRPLGTHVFTAQVDKDDANVLHWSVVTLPAPARAERRDEDERVSRRRKIAGAVEMKVQPVPDSPAEALDRLHIPADTMARINEALTTGGSIVVSDQGITAGETGEGTDFIVSLR
jgi:lipoprotein-anchoring transpeptidase ErfK/SrfK